MTGSTTAVALLASLRVVPAAVSAPRFPPPDFETGHALPATLTPPPDGRWIESLDLVLLAAALAITTWIVLKRRSRPAVFAMAACAMAYFGFWREGCICAIGSVQNVALALFDTGYALPASAAVFFALPLVFALFFGRTFCAAVCPHGAIQDLVAVRPVHVPAWLDRSLGLLRYLYLAAAVLFAATGSAFIICRYDPFVGLFRRSGTLEMLLLGGAMLVLAMFVVRPYCRYLCPYGVLLGWLARASKWHPRIDPSHCINCHLCADACPVDAIEGPAPDRPLEERAADRRRFGQALLMVPVIVALGVGAGLAVAAPMSRVHPTVQLARRVAAEEAALVSGQTDASRSFRARGAPIAELYEQSHAVQRRFRHGAPWFGAFMGLVFGTTALRLARRHVRSEYDIDRSRCVACARCFEYCPHDPKNLALLDEATTGTDFVELTASAGREPERGT